MSKSELVFVPSPGFGHLISTVELAKVLVNRVQRLSITVLIIKFPFDSEVDTYVESLSGSVTKSNPIRFVNLPQVEPVDSDLKPMVQYKLLIERQKPNVKDAVTNLMTESDSAPKLAGFVVDMFCTAMIDVANEFGVPTYMYFTSNACYLRFKFYFQELCDENGGNAAELLNSDTEFSVPCFVNSVPTRVFPTVLFDEESAKTYLDISRRARETKGIMVNTFSDLESHAMNSFLGGTLPPVYPVGPILNLKSDSSGGTEDSLEIISWLDDQPPSSVVFLCFGSMGSFSEDQVREIAHALEQSDVRFLWSLRQPPPNGEYTSPTDYSNLQQILPEGFLDRTDGIGKVIGWAPQVKVLAHHAIGGFVSHCGWNSTLESLWFGVPTATWPMYAEQQVNAFEMVVELGLAVEIKMDYRKDSATKKAVLVTGDEIERGIRKLMVEEGTETEILKKKVKEMSEKSRKAVMDGGSSFSSLNRFIDYVLDHTES